MRRFNTLLICIAAAIATPTLAQIPVSCVPPSLVTVPSADLQLQPGSAVLTLVATEGTAVGERSTGILELRRTSVADRSPTTGAAPARSDTVRTPLYGWTDLDFESVGAPVFTNDTLYPLPSSQDPVRPGVLVLIHNLHDPKLGHLPLLLIGTLTNRRDEEGWSDGVGIALAVRQIGNTTFSGTWNEWGLLMGGRGYFCARHDGP